LGIEGILSTCAGAGVEERSKGAAREIAANQQDRRIDIEFCKAWLFANLYFPQVGHYPKKGAHDFILIKSTQVLVCPWGFFQGFLPKNFMCNVFGFQFLLSL
jgi:hypothetical protein